jgi:hypothetical protein
MTDIHDMNASERPWWSVRQGLLATLLVLAAILVLLLSKPEVVERGLLIAGL